MRGIGFNANVSLDAWLFGEDKTKNESKASGYSVTGTSSMNRSNSLPASSLILRASKDLVESNVSEVEQASELSQPFPVSRRLRKFFRPKRIQWSTSRDSLPLTQEEKQQHISSIAEASFRRLQGHVPYTLKEIVKDPKKLPFLLRWLSADDKSYSTQTSYHQVLLFLLEIEQLQLVTEEKRKDVALKIWNKYIDHTSEFQIASTLELTPELEELVQNNIGSLDKVLDGFYPIQKLAYMRLTKEEMPRFLKSSEYIQMLAATENETEAIPMERILEKPRAAHYFLLFLMQSRQHFELYYWLHVEYVLKPLLDEAKYEQFWKLGSVLEQKARNDSQAITLSTKNDVKEALDTKKFDDKQQPPQPFARYSFSKAQQEIFVMLRSSWYDRFMKSNLYKIALKDSLIAFDRKSSKEDSPPKLLGRTFLVLQSNLVNHGDSLNQSDISISLGEQSDTEVQAEINVDEGYVDDDSRDDGDSEDSSSEVSDDESDEYTSVALDLESIIRLTKLPTGLQVHYRPHFDPPNLRVSSFGMPLDDAVVALLTFRAIPSSGTMGQPSLKIDQIMRSDDTPNPVVQKCDISHRVLPFLVPDGRLQRRNHEDFEELIFPFQQSEREGSLYGCAYLTYGYSNFCTSTDFLYAQGFCILSHLPLVDSLTKKVREYVQQYKRSATDRFEHYRLRELFRNVAPKELDIPMKSGNCVGSLEPKLEVPLEVFFSCFNTSLCLQILASAVLECSIVFVSSQYTLLNYCCEAVRLLIRPFTWCHVYAPVLPSCLLSYLQCPTPILVGVHSSFARRDDLPTSGLYMVADMDRGVVEFVGDSGINWRNLGLQDSRCGQIYLPEAFEDAKRKLDTILHPHLNNYDNLDDQERKAIPFSSVGIMEICFNLFSTLLTGYNSASLVVGDTKESVVIFDEIQFISNHASQDELFFKTLVRSQCFSEIVSAHSIDMLTKEDLS